MLIHDFFDDSIEVKAVTDTNGMIGVVQVTATVTLTPAMGAPDAAETQRVVTLYFHPIDARKLARAVNDKALQVDNGQYDPR